MVSAPAREQPSPPPSASPHAHRTSPTARAQGSTPDTQLRVISLPATRRDQAARIWAGLVHQTGADDLTTSWTWISAWLDAFGDAVDHRFLVVTDEGTGGAGAPVAIALATRGQRQRRGPLPIRTAHLGTAGEQGGVYVEYNRILALPGHRAAALQALTDKIAVGWWRTDLVKLDGFAPEELDGWDASGFRVDRRVCRVIDLESIRTGGQPMDKAFGSPIGRKLRQNTRRFTERFGPIEAEWITDPARAQVVFGEMVELHQARWVAAGEPGSFANPRLIRFHRELIDRLLPSGGVVLVRVTAGDQLVGVTYELNEHGALNHYNWGLMPVQADDGSLSPGFITALALMREGIDRGFREINWLAGDSRWKRELSTTTRELVWAERVVSPWAYAVRGALACKPLGPAAHARAAALRSRAAALRSNLPAISANAVLLHQHDDAGSAEPRGR